MRAVDQRVVADHDASGGADIEHRAEINRSAVANRDCVWTLAPEQIETEGGFNIGAAGNVHIGRHPAVVPVPGERSIGAHAGRRRHNAPITSAGLPPTRQRGATSLVTSEPGSMNEPLPIRTPFRIVAPGDRHLAGDDLARSSGSDDHPRRLADR